MAKKVQAIVKLQIPAGKATPAPPVGTALGPHGVNIVQFTKEFNAKTADKAGLIIPVVLTVYQDRSFTFITKTPPAAVLIKKALKLDSASGEPNKKKVGKLTKAQLKEIAEKIYNKLLDAGIEVMLDDRKERAGVKFNDRDLVGVPYRITVGKDAKVDMVEFSKRSDMENLKMPTDEAIEKIISSIKDDLCK